MSLPRSCSAFPANRCSLDSAQGPLSRSHTEDFIKQCERAQGEEPLAEVRVAGDTTLASQADLLPHFFRGQLVMDSSRQKLQVLGHTKEAAHSLQFRLRPESGASYWAGPWGLQVTTSPGTPHVPSHTYIYMSPACLLPSQKKAGSTWVLQPWQASGWCTACQLQYRLLVEPASCGSGCASKADEEWGPFAKLPYGADPAQLSAETEVAQCSQQAGPDQAEASTGNAPWDRFLQQSKQSKALEEADDEVCQVVHKASSSQQHPAPSAAQPASRSKAQKQPAAKQQQQHSCAPRAVRGECTWCCAAVQCLPDRP